MRGRNDLSSSMLAREAPPENGGAFSCGQFAARRGGRAQLLKTKSRSGNIDDLNSV
jgi:hypothetical protein